MKLIEAVTIDDDVRQFVQWAMKTLGGSAAASNRDDLMFRIPEDHRAYFQGAKVAQLVYGSAVGASRESPPAAVDDPEQAPSIDAPRIPVDAQFLAWLMEQLSCAADVPVAVPTLPAVRVHEISTRLFQAYTVDGGTLHMSGCTLENRPVLRQTSLVFDDSDQPQLVHRFTDPQGGILSDTEIKSLGLTSLQRPTVSLPRLGQEDVRAWSVAAQDQLATNSDPKPARAADVATVVWCQYAAGKIEFVIDDASAEVAFSGWARQLVTGQVDPPAFQCPITGIQSHAISITDDGRITAREAIQVCAISGRRLLTSELAVCAQTGQTVLPEYLVTCPVSGQRVVETALEPCGTCLQPVSSACVENGICKACRTMISVRKDDPRMARVLGEYPQLDRWRNWRIGETSTSYVLVAAAFIKRILVVVNKESLEMVRLATRNRFSSRWTEPPLTERQELLR